MHASASSLEALPELLESQMFLVCADYTKNSWKYYTTHVRTLQWLIVDWKEREKKNQSELSGSATQVTSNLSNHHQKEL